MHSRCTDMHTSMFVENFVGIFALKILFLVQQHEFSTSWLYTSHQMADLTDNIRVVDAEPQAPASNAGSQGSPINPNAILNNTLDGFANLSSKFNPFAQRLNKGIGQVRQVGMMPSQT